MRGRLLLVDDEPRNLKLLEAILTPLGCEVTTAGSGAEALAAIDREPFDLVILDLLMPEVDGFEVLGRVRSRLSAERLPIIVATAHAEREPRLRALSAGANDYLEKPIDAPVLLLRVRALLELKTSRDELVRRNDKLEALRQEQRELTEFIVHDLRSPLSSLLLNLDFARKELTAEQVSCSEALGDVSEAALRIRSMVEDLLTVSRLEEARYPVRAEPVLVHDLLKGLVDENAVRARAKGVDLRSQEGRSGIRVQGDRWLLSRVLENLVDNALRYTPRDGSIAVSANANGSVEICVSNAGDPIPPAERKRIFEKFARGNTERVTGGNAGLGLYFCKKAVEAQGGQISVIETALWPTSFVLNLPAA